MNYDRVLSSVGEFGAYQKRLCFLIFLVSIPAGYHIPSATFDNITPDYRCAIPGLNNDSYTIRDPFHKSLIQELIPDGEDGEPYSHCTTYNLNRSGHDADQNQTRDCHRWVFDDSSVKSQIVQFDLVCDRQLYKAHNSMMALLGVLVGSLIGGTFSDHFGRKKTAIVALVVTGPLGGVMAALPSFSLILACRFLLCCVSTTVFLASYVLLVENVGISRRSQSSMTAQMGFAAGCLYLVLMQYLFRDWRTAQLVGSLTLMTLGLCWWVLQESPRWLLTKNRVKEAKEIIAYIAKVNKSLIPPEAELTDGAAMMKSYGVNEIATAEGDEITSTSTEMKLWHICSSRRYVLYLIILCFCWVVINMVFYGLLLGAGTVIEGDIYVNFALQAAMEALASTVGYFIVEKWDRKKIFCSSLISSGLATLGIGGLILADQDIRWLSLILFCVGKLCITIGFTLVYIITTELMPTKIRNSGLGFCSFVARFSGIVSPYIVSASLLIPGPIGKAFPVLTFGVLSLAAGSAAILLPETRNTKLPEELDSEANEDEK